MRDGIRLATDLYRPARDGELVEGRYPDDRLHHAVRQDRAALHARSPTSSSRTATPSCLQDMRDRHRSEGTREYFHARRRTTGEDGYDTIEWIAAQPLVERPHRHGRQLVRRDHAGPHGARARRRT